MMIEAESEDFFRRMVRQSWAYQNLMGQDKAWTSFTPTLTFGTPGDLAVTYTRRLGTYRKAGRLVTCNVAIVTSTFTHTTAAGNLTVTGFPFTSVSTTGSATPAPLIWSGITLGAGLTNVMGQLQANSTSMIFRSSGSGVAVAAVTTAEVPTGGSVELRLTIDYETTG